MRSMLSTQGDKIRAIARVLRIRSADNELSHVDPEQASLSRAACIHAIDLVMLLLKRVLVNKHKRVCGMKRF